MLVPLNSSAHQHPEMVKMVENLDLLREAHWRKEDNEIHRIKELILGVLPRTGALKPGLVRSICSCHWLVLGEQALFDGHHCQSRFYAQYPGNFVYYV